MEIEDYLDSVKDQNSFLEFVRALQEDKENEDQKEKENPSEPFLSGHNGWENNTISSYLEAALSWAEDSDFGEKIESTPNTWKKIALFMYSGKVYE